MAKESSQRLWIGIILVVIGAMILLDNLDILEFGDLIGNWWPVIFIIIGAFKLKEPNKNSALIFIAIGALLLLMSLDIVDLDDILQFWPLILIFIGLSLLFKSRREKTAELSENSFKLSAIFGGVEREIVSNNLQDGEVSVVFGGAEIDMTKATIAESGATLDLTAMFGGIELRVPKNTRVLVLGSPILGGIENRTSRETADTQPTIRCHCNVVAGGIEIRD